MINIDGLPLAKSSRSQVWPILGRITNIENFNQPFCVACYYSYEKPKDPHVFLRQFREEYLRLSVRGFIHDRRIFYVRIRLVVLDTIARNFILAFPAHNSRCGACVQIGKTVARRRLFLNMNSALRTDENFRVGVKAEFRNKTSPLEGIGISITKQVPLDPMHLLDLGVVKKHVRIFVFAYGEGQLAQLRGS